MAAPARIAAFRTLRALADGRRDLGSALAQLRDPLSDPRDRALATDLATGTLRWRLALDYQLQQRSAKPLAKLDAAVLDALRLGAYQLLHLERVPASAVINDSVDLVKTGGFRSATGFVNAVLRRLARDRGTLSWPDRHDLGAHLAVVHSHPEWLVRRWLVRYGVAATAHWLAFNNLPPALTLATNRLRGPRAALIERLAGDGVETVATEHAPHGLRVVNGQPLSSPSFREGYCLVQDEASQIIPELAHVDVAARVLDLCAAPGGKTVALAAQCTPAGLVVASDVRPRRARLVAATLARCQVRHAKVLVIPARGPLPFRDEAFDCVLIDAPCSGLGTVRRDPDIRWRRSPEDFAQLAASQHALLQRVRSLVRPGGRVVYSTCSSEPEENEHVVTAFLGEAHEFVVQPLRETGAPAGLGLMETADGYLRTSPAYGLEAFFGAVLHKAG